jgi:hypothetical protein
MYTRSWDQGLTYQLDDYIIPIPDMPEERLMTNFYLPINQQKFKYFDMPDMKGYNQQDLDALAERAWHIREHGEWQLINGQPTYIDPGTWFFMNFWRTTMNQRPTFRWEAVEFFRMWYLLVERTPEIEGILIVKCRRIGDSDKSLCINYERSTRYFNCSSGLQSATDEDAQKNFSRIVRSWKAMPYFFKPKISGTPTERLAFSRPSEISTLKKLKEKREDVIEDSDGEFLDSSISFRATTNLAYDGDRLFFYHLDECFKIPPHRMNIKSQLENIRRVMSLNNGLTQFGKCIFTSTVEEAASGIDASTVAMAEELWDMSDWNDRDDNGKTKSGLVRLFRGYLKNARIDEFGFPQVEEARRHRDNKVKALMMSDNEDGLLSLKRKEPETVEDAFSRPTTDCPLHPKMCETRLYQLKNGLDRQGNKVEKNEVIIGNLQWKNGKPNTEVEFVRSPNGRWHFSQFPFRENAIVKSGATYKGENMPFYRLGCDPYDSDSVVHKGSDGAMAVFRRFNLLHENQSELEFDELGDVKNPWAMKTRQFVCAYKYRHQDPEDFYKDYILTCWYFGISGYVEIDKPGLLNWCNKNGYKGLLQREPDELISGLHRRREARQGSKTTTHLVSNYVGLLSSHISKQIWAEKIPMIISNWQTFTTAKRTKFDVAVATGWALIGDLEEQKQFQKQQNWGANSFYLNN